MSRSSFRLVNIAVIGVIVNEIVCCCLVIIGFQNEIVKEISAFDYRNKSVK
jgi:hypothetical protein